MKLHFCRTCKTEKPLSKFHVNSNGKLKAICIVCNRVKYKTKYDSGEYSNNEKRKKRVNYANLDPVKRAFNNWKRNARVNNREFTLEFSDLIPLPSHCPVLGIELVFNKDFPQDNSYSLDRIDNTKGYVKGNVIVVSHKVNSIKRNSSIEELEKIVNFYKTTGVT